MIKPIFIYLLVTQGRISKDEANYLEKELEGKIPKKWIDVDREVSRVIEQYRKNK